jgi:hypothetical protein
MFAIGVGHYVYEHFDIDRIKFLASSSGTFAAVPLACGLDPYDWCRRDWAKCIEHFESRGALGCLYDTKHFYYNLWDEYLPKDAHVRCSGRLFISVTLFPSMKNRVVSQFNSREELIWTIVGSICLPYVFIADFPVKCSDEIGYVLDGGFSNDSPCLDSYTITVSALHRKADVQPIMLNGGAPSSPHGVHHTRHADKSPARATKQGGCVGAWKARCGWQVTPADYDNPMTGCEDSGPALKAVEESDSCSDSCGDTDSSEGNLLVDSAVADAEQARKSGGHSNAAYEEGTRIRPIDIIRVPKYDRVWQIGAMGQTSAAQCLDFERHEWVSIRRTQGAWAPPS